MLTLALTSALCMGALTGPLRSPHPTMMAKKPKTDPRVWLPQEWDLGVLCDELPTNKRMHLAVCTAEGCKVTILE